MTKNYTQLSLGQKYQIEALRKTGMSEKSIAQVIGVHPSTVCRELRRNTPSRGRSAGAYAAIQAQTRTQRRHQQKAKCIRFTEGMKKQASHWLIHDKWSPEIISAIGRHTGLCPISHESLYRWIWDCKRSHKAINRPYHALDGFMKHGRRRRKRGRIKDSRGTIPGRVSIEKRPEIVGDRIRPGDFEADLMMSRNRKGAVLVVTDRATLHTRIRKLKGKHSKGIKKALTKALGNVPYPVHTITFDNDKAFSCHQDVARLLEVETYFTRPYTSQEKGTVENRIGVIRRFIPKRADITKISPNTIRRVERLINNRPVRKFNYRTPNQVLQEKIALIT
jgi:IS30 family transposase